MSEHTPGPWSFDADWHRLPTIFGADRSKIATIEKEDFIHSGKFPGTGHTKQKPEREANAHLIVAAPEMLAAHSENARVLRLLVSELQGRVEGGKLAAIALCLGRSNDAIAKATNGGE